MSGIETIPVRSITSVIDFSSRKSARYAAKAWLIGHRGQDEHY